jgi:hypothetical protein
VDGGRAGLRAEGGAKPLSAAVLWQMSKPEAQIEVSVPGSRFPRRPGIKIHRRSALCAGDVTRHHGVPVTTPIATLIDIAARLDRNAQEEAINEADQRDLVDLETLRATLETTPHRPGLARLRRTIDRRTFTFTRSPLERRFLPIARRAGLPKPLTAYM